MLKSRARKLAGAAMVEFQAVALLGLLPLCLGLLQSALLAIENHHVDHAAFMAARAGATAHGDTGTMRQEFARAMTPLFVTSSDPLDSGNVTGRVLSAYARALQDIALYGSIKVLSPDAAAQRDFGRTTEGIRAIPNDSLEHRSNSAGRESGVSLQAANILQVEFTYCRPLIVPFARQMLIGVLQRMDAAPAHQRCYVAGRIPVVSTGIAPMQSDFRTD